MKKFFKALALVLALTLVIGTIPVSADTATIGIKKNRKSWVVFLDGAKGLKADGTQAGRKRTYKISKLVEGFDEETMDIKLESTDKTVVKTSNKKDKVYGQKMGSALVNIYVYDKESEKLIGSTAILIKVKKNATEVNYYVADSEGNLVDTSKKLGVNVPYTLVLTRLDAEGNKTDTDYRRLTCEDASVTIEADEAYSAHTKYTVTFTKSGEFTLIGGAYQSEAYNANHVEAEIKLTAGYDAVSVAQSGLATADVTFETDVVGLTADQFKAYYLVGETKIYPSAAQKVTCKDNVATVEFLSNFISGTEYFVEYDGTVAGSFKAATITADSVVAIEIPTQQFEAGAANQKLQYKLLDENGLDLKSLLGSTLNGILSFEIVNGDIDTYITSGNEPIIYIGTANKQYVVKATYTWIDSKGDTKKAEGQGNVVSVTPAVWEIGTVTGIITATNAGNYIGGDGKIDGNVKAITWTLDNAVSGAALQIAVPYTKNGTTVYEGFNYDAEPSIYTKYTAKSNDETVVMLATATPDGQKWILTANKAGTATIIIYGVDANGKENVIGAVPVEVKAKREAKTLTVTPSKNTLNEGYAYDYVEFTVVVKDQYDEEMKGLTYTVTNANANDGSNGPIFTNSGATNTTGNAFTIWGDEVTTKTGVLNVKFACGNLSQTVYINCGNEADAKTYVLKLLDKDDKEKNTLDTSIKQDTKWTDLYVTLEGRSQSGYAAPGVDPLFVAATPKSEQTVSGAALGVKFVFTVTKDGKVLSAADLGPAFEYYGDFNAVAPFGTSGAAVKFAKGTYTITAYKVATDEKNVIVSVVGTQILTVEDKQIMPTVTKKDNAEKLGGLTDADIASAFEVKFNGSTSNITTVFNYTVDGEGKTAYVKEAYVTVPNINININKPITKNICFFDFIITISLYN